MKIPKKFRLFQHEIEVKELNDLVKHADCYGISKQRQHLIEIEKDLIKTTKEQTFCHELTHMILSYMEEKELSDNEKFVNLFSELLYQAIETMEY